jgi:hypothetical protein
MSMSCHFSGSGSCCGIVALFECSEPFWVSWTLTRNVQIVSYVSFKIHTLLFLNMGEQSEDLQKVVDFLAIRLRHARTLLIHHRWNVESLFGKLAETGTNEIFLEAGLPPPEDLCSRPQICEPSFISCGICLDDAPQKEATRMDCGHAFCNDCKHTCSLDSTTIVSVHHQCLIELSFNLLS